MKKFVVASLAALSLNAVAHESHEKNYVFKGDRSYAGFCKAAANDNVKLLRRSFANKVGVVAGSKRDVYRILLTPENLTCNGVSLVEFSKQRNAEQVLAYLQTASAEI